ncbi:hypothetical protein [Nonomuraea longicatena]|uniref:Uncharacterized protein n=1 Tax=Nonomuraea longicatena TaxID=83682 RepID=A0ABP3Z920_9ACTN
MTVLAEPTATVRTETRALIGAGEAPHCPSPGSEKGAGLLLLALLLSADPTQDEPIEDAFGGVLQNLTCAAAF